MNKCHASCLDSCTLVQSFKEKLVSAEALAAETHLAKTRAEEELHLSLRMFEYITDFTDLRTTAIDLLNVFIRLTQTNYATIYLFSKGKVSLIETTIERRKAREMQSAELSSLLDARLVTPFDIGSFPILLNRGVGSQSGIVVPLYDSLGQKQAVLVGEALEAGFFISHKLELCRVFGKMAAITLESAVSYSSLQRLAYIDSIIDGAFNKKYLSKLDKDLLFKNGVVNKPFVSSIFDIDKFKTVNDIHGHLIGDEAIKEVGELILKRIRSSDYLIRFGGDEMIILLYNLSDMLEGVRIIEDIRSLIENHKFTEKKISLTCSFGVAGSDIFNGKQPSFDGLFRTMNAALYKAKEAGRNKVEYAAVLA